MFFLASLRALQFTASFLFAFYFNPPEVKQSAQRDFQYCALDVVVRDREKAKGRDNWKGCF